MAEGRKASCGHEYLRANCDGCEEHLTAVTGIPVRKSGREPTPCVVCKAPTDRPFCAECMAQANRDADAYEAEESK